MKKDEAKLILVMVLMALVLLIGLGIVLNQQKKEIKCYKDYIEYGYSSENCSKYYKCIRK